MHGLTLGALLLSLLIPAFRPAAAEPKPADVLKRYEQVLADHSPLSAAILDEKDFMDALLKADPVKHSSVFRAKSHLRDLKALVNDHKEAFTLRAALRARSHAFYDDLWTLSGLGPEPQKLEAWAEKYYGKAAGERFAEALWEQRTLKAGPKAFIKEQGLLFAEHWPAMFFRARDASLSQWARTKADAILAAKTPWTAAQRKTFLGVYGEISGMLSRDEVSALAVRFNQQDALGGALSHLKGKTLAPDLKDELKLASDPKLPIEERLGALAKIFENSNVSKGVAPSYNKYLDVQRAPRAGETFTAQQKLVLASMLPTAYLKQAAKVPGHWLNDYYKKHPLKVSIESLSGALAQYHPETKTIAFSAAQIEAWLRVNKKTPADFISDKAVLESFILQTAPVFVHEATHQRYNERFAQSGTQFHHQGAEVEATYEETAFAILLARKDKRLKDFINDEQSTSSFARCYATQIDALNESPRKFKQIVITGFYPGYPTLHGMLARNQQYYALATARVLKLLPGGGKGMKTPTPQEIKKLVNIDFYAWMKTKHTPHEYHTVLLVLRQGEKELQALYKDMQKAWTETSVSMDKFWKENCAPKPKTAPQKKI